MNRGAPRSHWSSRKVGRRLALDVALWAVVAVLALVVLALLWGPPPPAPAGLVP
ncbi:hypothetical protein [Cellulomonas alba]|uniref:Uncharacterized protein n=1 Tax=Cellulomonas alba TaxID=3053467 RepID=A0ABT7SEG5_9CELL|nr:hypothetical protein [Cellulomonas alba]MDM7854565.1 hypothetical protein [Cellulomonas alba]